jgi:uncharacterized protein (UPF0335 family)
MRALSKKAVSEDAFERLGHNAAGVLKGHVEGIESELEAIERIRKSIRNKKAAAKKDGFEVRVLDAIIKKRKIDPATRLLFEEMVKKAELALNMPSLFDFAKAGDIIGATEREADAEAAA